MTNGQSLNDRDAEITQTILKHFFQGEVTRKHILWNPTEVPQANASQVLQQSSCAPMGQHSVDPIGRFANVFQYQDCAIQ